MEVPGSLLQAMQEVISSSAVLVIDTAGYREGWNEVFDYGRWNYGSIKDPTAAQQKVIMLAQAYNCPIFLVQYHLNYTIGPFIYDHVNTWYLHHAGRSRVIHPPLRALLPMHTQIINKHTDNAFLKTGLLGLLAQANQGCGVKNLVVVGYHANICIPATIGPNFISSEGCETGLGAIDHKFNVLSCKQVLDGVKTDWSWVNKSSKIKFYNHL